MPLVTNQDDYLKFYIDESLPLFDKINKIIKKGESMQRQALINNLLKDLIQYLHQILIRLIKTIQMMKKMMIQKKIVKLILKSSMASDNSNIENLMDKEDIYIKIAIIISGILTIMGAVLNMAMSLIGNKLTLTFGYSKNDNSLEELVMNHTMIYILLVVIIIFNVGLLVVVISGKDTSFGKLIYNELNWYFVLTQSALGFQFLITLIWEIDLWTINVCLSVSMLAILILAFYFTEIKKKTNMSVNTIIFIFIYISVLFSFIAYLTLFNISCILMENIEDENSEYKTTSSIVIKIAINALQTILSILLLTYYKDIFFAISSAYIESAIFIHLETDYKSGENITCLVFVCTIILGIILTIVSLKKKIFGIEGEKFQTN